MNASSESGLWAMRTVVTAPAGGAVVAAGVMAPLRYQSARLGRLDRLARGQAALSLPFPIPLLGTVAREPVAEAAVLEVVVVGGAVIVGGPDGMHLGHLEAALATAAGLGDETAFEPDVVVADQAMPAAYQRVQRTVMLLDHDAVIVRADRDVAVDVRQAGVAARLRRRGDRHAQDQGQGREQQDAVERSLPEIHHGSPFRRRVEATWREHFSPDLSKGPAKLF